MNNSNEHEVIVEIEVLQDGSAELDADAICTCGGMCAGCCCIS